jgi:hypothetical protein
MIMTIFPHISFQFGTIAYKKSREHSRRSRLQNKQIELSGPEHTRSVPFVGVKISVIIKSGEHYSLLPGSE